MIFSFYGGLLFELELRVLYVYNNMYVCDPDTWSIYFLILVCQCNLTVQRKCNLQLKICRNFCEYKLYLDYAVILS